VQNFIWGGKAATTRAKVKWETLVLPTTKGGLGIIDPRTQSEALLTKLLIRDLEPRGKPWKELLRHKADQVRLLVHALGPNTQDIHWLFYCPQTQKTTVLPVEKYSGSMDECEARFKQSGSNQRNGVA
jgi:hypothetical protein